MGRAGVADRLQALLRANRAVIAQLELPAVLQRIVDSALELVDARYGALGVIDPVSGALEQFVYAGISPELAREIGPVPQGHGLLAALIDDPRPIRVEHLAADPRFTGFPPHHPQMDSLIDVPIRIRDEVYGNLYLADRVPAGGFDRDDEELLEWLADTAGQAIENARLFAEAGRQQRWAAAAAEVTASLLTADPGDPVVLIADRVFQVSDAAHVRVVVPTDDTDTLLVRAARGVGAEVEGTLIPVSGTVAGAVLEGKNPSLIEDEGAGQFRALLPDGHTTSRIIAVPLLASGVARGVLIVVREVGQPRFTSSELELVADFAGQAALAMEFMDGRAAQQRMALYEDRARIARDLHDHVIQQLFASGLELESVSGTLGDPNASARVTKVIDHLDEAIAQIRTVIFALREAPESHDGSLRHAVIDLVGQFEGGLARTPAVAFTGPVDLVATGGMADDALAVVREALANVAKHSHARNARVSVSASDEAFEIEVADDGIGIPDSSHRSGLENLESRARRRGGTLVVEHTEVGTRVRWKVPLETGEGSDAR